MKVSKTTLFFIPIQYLMETFMLLEMSWGFLEVPWGDPCLTSNIKQ